MSWLFDLLGGGQIVAILGGIAAVVLAIFGFRWDAKQDERKDAKIADLEANEKTRKDVEDAVESSHAGGAAWVDRLRDSADD